MTQSTSYFISEIFEDACNSEASDIHFYPNEQKVAIFYRIYGRRQYRQSITPKQYNILLTYIKFSANMDIAEQRKPQDGLFSFKNSLGEQFSLRLSTLPMLPFESLSIRIIPLEQIPILEKLILFPYQINELKSCLQHQNGMIVLSGPTGSGKSTTMYALIEHLVRSNAYQVITLEDPVERKLDTVIQVEINEKAGITYQAGLKAALRHDPDVLLIGEIRDKETAKFAVRAALTGHLVLTTVHAKNTVSTIDRLMEFGISKHELTQTLVAIATVQLLNVIKGKDLSRRAAIVELLHDSQLSQTLAGEVNKIEENRSLKYLTEKAHLYGFTKKDN